MKTKISNLQTIFLTANFVFSSVVVSMPQVILGIGGQNGWMVPILLFPIYFLIIYFTLGRKRNTQTLENLFDLEAKGRRNFIEKGFVILFLLNAMVLFLRDLRATVDFVGTVLLPTTPIDMITILLVLVIAYISTSGLEVVARVTTLHFGLLLLIVLLLPLLLLNEMDIGNFQPLPSIGQFMDVIGAGALTFSWVGEIFLILIVVSHINPSKEVRRSVFIGTGLTLFLFSIILLLEVSVLGPDLVREATYPSYVLIEQINITDFLDRLDPFIVVIWLPTIITKLTFLLYAINHCVSFLGKKNTNKFMFPVSLILGYLSILIFKNNMDHLHFSLFTWSTLGIALEVIIIVMFWIVRIMARKKESVQN